MNASGQVEFAAVPFHAGGNLAAELIADAGTDTLVLATTATVAVLLGVAGWSQSTPDSDRGEAGHPRGSNSMG